MKIYEKKPNEGQKPERKGWSTVREHVGIRIKELAKKLGLTVNDYLESAIGVIYGVKPDEKWITYGLCGVGLKARNLSEHMEKVHPKGR